jgi:hypothetical protein
MNKNDRTYHDFWWAAYQGCLLNPIVLCIVILIQTKNMKTLNPSKVYNYSYRFKKMQNKKKNCHKFSE